MIFVQDNTPNFEEQLGAMLDIRADAYEQGRESALDEADERNEQIRNEVRTDIAKECRYLLNCGMGKKKSLEHLIRILEKGLER